jgi:glycosyltransferase involved in cell wall biosynthesis
MPVKRYGIYLFYRPTATLRGEGLGRYLSAFLKAAQGRPDIRLIVACPSWMRAMLSDLCREEGVDEAGFDIIAPPRQPLILRLRDWYEARRKKPRSPSRSGRFLSRLRRGAAGLATPVERWLAGNRSVTLLVGFILVTLPVVSLAVAGWIVIRVVRWVLRRLIQAMRLLTPKSRLHIAVRRLKGVVLRPSHDATGPRLFHLMEQAEVAHIHRLIRGRTDIGAWYCPTAFWPHFNQISAPRLICVPDIVFIDFPGAFALSNGPGGYETFRNIETTIAGGDHFVTYSDYVKWNTLVDRYQVDPDAVSTVHHGASRLDDVIAVAGRSSGPVARDALYRTFFAEALAKSTAGDGAAFVFEADIRFLFFASQFRPNKNIITLLRAYEHLLKRRYRGHKLVLTGDPKLVPDIHDFIRDHHLENDVLFLHRLTLPQLAACYRLADLVINPSLSEGGFPFTFTEALSVGTPVVASDIPVAEEILGGQEFYADMTFDPYDWRDMSTRIEWALDHRDALFERQNAFYESVLVKRTWRDLVDDHIAIMERIADPHAP